MPCVQIIIMYIKSILSYVYFDQIMFVRLLQEKALFYKWVRITGLNLTLRKIAICMSKIAQNIPLKMPLA